MIKLKTAIFYCIGDDMPSVGHLPHGTDAYNKLNEFNSLDETVIAVRDELANLENSLDKYDHPYENEHIHMCKQMKSLKNYLVVALVQLENVQEIGN